MVYSDGLIYSVGWEVTNVTDNCNNNWQSLQYFPCSKLVLVGYNATTGERKVYIDLTNSLSLGAPFSSTVFTTTPIYSLLGFVIKNDTAFIKIYKRDEAYTIFTVIVTAINLTNNNILWKNNFSYYPLTPQNNRNNQEMTLSGDVLFVIGQNIEAYNINTGKKVWEFSDPLGGAYGFSGLIVQDNLLFIGAIGQKIYAFEQGYNGSLQITNNLTDLPLGQEQVPYLTSTDTSYTFKVINGEAPYNWDISSGRLPNGLNLINDSDNFYGIFNGAPIETGDFNFTIRVTDKRGSYAEKQFRLNIIPNSWIPKESNRFWTSIAMSEDGSRQNAVAYNGQIYISIDYGNTWTPKESSRNWYGIAMSADGSRQTAVAHGSQIYVSTDYGNTWTPKDSSRNWYRVAMSADGSRQTAVVIGGQIYVSTDYGNTWTPKDSNRSWYGIAMSADGSRQTATVSYKGQIYISTDYGNTWNPKDSNRSWYGIAMSADGSRQTAVVNGGQIYVSTDYGNTWTPKDSNRSWYGVAMSEDGLNQTAVGQGIPIYMSNDYGNTWINKSDAKAWYHVAMSADGSVQTAVVLNGKIYIYHQGSQGMSGQSFLKNSSLKPSTLNAILSLFRVVLDSIRNSAGIIGKVIWSG
jgi:photosystem II stability/assembly factor-like uncharacterized protein